MTTSPFAWPIDATCSGDYVGRTTQKTLTDLTALLAAIRRRVGANEFQNCVWPRSRRGSADTEVPRLPSSSFVTAGGGTGRGRGWGCWRSCARHNRTKNNNTTAWNRRIPGFNPKLSAWDSREKKKFTKSIHRFTNHLTIF